MMKTTRRAIPMVELFSPFVDRHFIVIISIIISATNISIFVSYIHVLRHNWQGSCKYIAQYKTKWNVNIIYRMKHDEHKKQFT